MNLVPLNEWHRVAAIDIVQNGLVCDLAYRTWLAVYNYVLVFKRINGSCIYTEGID